MVVRQLLAAISRSPGVSGNCISFSASANVVVETSGPTAGAVPNAPGEAGGSSSELWAKLRCTVAATNNPIAVCVKNSLRDFAIILRTAL
jgi:hypothetical protein